MTEKMPFTLPILGTREQMQTLPKTLHTTIVYGAPTESSNGIRNGTLFFGNFFGGRLHLLLNRRSHISNLLFFTVAQTYFRSSTGSHGFSGPNVGSNNRTPGQLAQMQSISGPPPYTPKILTEGREVNNYSENFISLL